MSNITILLITSILICQVLVPCAASTSKFNDWLCGPKCLSFICQSYGVEASIDELADVSKCDKDSGTSLLDLHNAAASKGLKSIGLKISVDELIALSTPAIAHLWDNHFVVVNGGTGDMIKVIDPSKSPVLTFLVSKDEFNKVYSGFALLVSKNDAAFSLSESTGADMRVDSYTWDFGLVDEGTELIHTFTCTNKGNEKLIISKIDTSCGCIATLPSEESLAPGAQVTITAAMDTMRQLGPLWETVYIHTNDKITPVVQLNLQAVVKPSRLLIWPRSIDFNRVQSSEGAEKRIYISRFSDEALRIEKVSSDTPHLLASLNETTKYQEQLQVILIKLLPGAPIGNFHGTITVETNHPKEPKVIIPVSAAIMSDITTSPTTLFLGRVKKGFPVTRELTVSTTEKRLFDIDKVTSPYDYMHVAVESAQGGHYIITASLLEDAPVGYVDGQITLHTTDPHHPSIEIPIYAQVVNE